MSLRLDGYVRVSRIGGREGEGYISPDLQREAIERYARELDGEIVAWHDDQDYSGGNMERPGFQDMLARLRSGETDGIVVKCVDRFARSVADGSAIVREIAEADQVIALCDERIDTRTPEGMYMLHQFLANAELFLSRIKKTWKASKAKAIDRGAHIGPTPVGYLKVEAIPSKPTHISPVDSAALGGPTAPGRLVPNPDVAPAMTGLFARAATGQHGDTALARWFADQAPHPADRTWQPSEVRRWLASRVYLGEVCYGGHSNPEAHEPLTDVETWERCQRKPGVQLRPHSTFLLSGLVRCACCRYSMGGQTYGGYDGGTPVYRCTGRSGCAEPSVIVAARLDRHVEQTARAHLVGYGARGRSGPDLAAIDREANRAVQEVDAFVADTAARRLMGDDAWQTGLKVRVAERDAQLARRAEAFAANQHAALAHRIEEAGAHELGDLLQIVRHVFVRRGARGASAAARSLIVWADDPAVIDVPGPHRSGPFERIAW
jgi:DNA invertase Pin-like site-specific DNA recombinase